MKELKITTCTRCGRVLDKTKDGYMTKIRGIKKLHADICVGKKVKRFSLGTTLAELNMLVKT